MNLMNKMVVLALLAQVAAVSAADSNGWAMRLGASYRAFQDVDFNSMPFRNWGNNNNAAGPFGIQNITQIQANNSVTPLHLDYVKYKGGSDGFSDGDGLAPMIGIVRELTQVGPFVLSLSANLQYYQPDLEFTASGNMAAKGDFEAEQYKHFMFNLPPPTVFPAANPELSPSNVSSFSLKNQFDMDLWVLDVGLEARTDFDFFSLNFALGPTLNIANVETSQIEQAAWSNGVPVIYGPDGYSQPFEDKNTDFIPGLYGAVGLSFNLNENWAVGAEYRYDWVSEDVGTDQGLLDLTGSSAQLKVIYKF